MADEDKIVEILEDVPLFGGLRQRQLQRLARIFIERTCASGEVIVPQGRDGYGFFVVVSGAAEAILEHSDGSTEVVNTFGPTEFFGELALLDSGPRTASVVATDTTECLILPRESFLGMLRRDGDMAVEIAIELARRFRTALETR